MKDRFKFRAWYQADGEDGDMLYEGSFGGYHGEVFKWLREGQPITIMQSTGLKDKNDNLIFEGDIVKATFYNPKIREVVYGKGMFMLVHSDPMCCNVEIAHFYKDGSNGLEIIGDIYENSELLKKGEKDER